MKRLMLVLAIIAVTCTLKLDILPYAVHPVTMEDRYQVWQSYAMDGGGYRDTTMWVILKTKRFKDLDTIFDEVKNNHDVMNGESDCLTIHLYKSKEELDQNLELGSKTYYKVKRSVR